MPCVIMNRAMTVAGIGEGGALRYAHGERKPMVFADETAAAAWWAENAPTLPPLREADASGEVPIRAVAVAEHAAG